MYILSAPGMPVEVRHSHPSISLESHLLDLVWNPYGQPPLILIKAKRPHQQSCPLTSSQAYLEEVIHTCVDVIKDNLKNNITVFYEARFARQWRPSWLKEGET